MLATVTQLSMFIKNGLSMKLTNNPGNMFFIFWSLIALPKCAEMPTTGVVGVSV